MRTGIPGWTRFLAGRAVAAAVTMGVLSVLVFAATEVLPGDASGALAGADASAAQRAQIRAELGLDRSAVAALPRLGRRRPAR